MKSKTAIIAPGTGIEDFLKSKGVNEIVYTRQNPLIQPALAFHPDMNITFLNEKCAVVNGFQHDTAEMLKSRGVKVIKTDFPNRKEYPFDVALNAVCFNKKLFGLKKFLSPELLNETEKSGIETINCKQGYTHCSVLKISETAAVTGDKGIYEALKNNGIDTLLVTNDGIQLKGYDCGFIGGCSFMLDKDSLALNGSLSCHPDGKRIKDFCMCHGVAFFEMSQGPLTDIGGGFVFP